MGTAFRVNIDAKQQRSSTVGNATAGVNGIPRSTAFSPRMSEPALRALQQTCADINVTASKVARVMTSALAHPGQRAQQAMHRFSDVRQQLLDLLAEAESIEMETACGLDTLGPHMGLLPPSLIDRIAASTGSNGRQVCKAFRAAYDGQRNKLRFWREPPPSDEELTSVVCRCRSIKTLFIECPRSKLLNVSSALRIITHRNQLESFVLHVPQKGAVVDVNEGAFDVLGEAMSHMRTTLTELHVAIVPTAADPDPLSLSLMSRGLLHAIKRASSTHGAQWPSLRVLRLELHLTDRVADGADLGDLFRSLPAMSTLAWNYGDTRILSDVINATGDSLTSLDTLSICDSSDSPQTAEEMAGALGKLVWLKDLKLQNNAVTNTCVVNKLLRHACSRFVNLQCLTISMHRLDMCTNNGLQQLVNELRCFHHLRGLHMNFTHMNAAFDLYLLPAIATLTQLTSLSLPGAGIGPSSSLAALSTLSSLKSLDLHQNDIRSAGFAKLAVALRMMPEMSHLFLRNTYIDDAAALHIAKLIEDGHLQDLQVVTLDHNRITDVGLGLLALSFKRLAHLKKVTIWKNNADYTELLHPAMDVGHREEDE